MGQLCPSSSRPHPGIPRIIEHSCFSIKLILSQSITLVPFTILSFPILYPIPRGMCVCVSEQLRGAELPAGIKSQQPLTL